MRKMPRIRIKDLPSDLKISREEMQKIVGGAVLMKTSHKSGFSNLGLTLIDMLAETADLLSAYQDDVANEAYLSTAGQRSSLRDRRRLRD